MPGESHGLKSLSGYSPEVSKTEAEQVRIHASQNRGCHCRTKVSKRLSAEIIGDEKIRDNWLVFNFCLRDVKMIDFK